MTKDEFYEIASPQKFVQIAKHLNNDERDILKYKLSRLGVEELIRDYDIPSEPKSLNRFNIALESLANIHPYRWRVPMHGIAYLGRPSFMNDTLLNNLLNEAIEFRTKAIMNIEQYISCAETKNRNSIAEKLEDNAELLTLIERYAGKCQPSYISNYIYYDAPGHCSKPHVDNAFTSITVMIGLQHNSQATTSSFSFSYWPNLPRFDYKLKPGDMAIFYGAATLHGRTPVSKGENVISLLLSFRPE